MVNLKVEGVNIFDPIKDKIPKIIEYLVDFYGEKYRESITNKIENAHFMFLPKEEVYPTRTTVADYYSERLKEIMKKCWEETLKKANPDYSRSLLQFCSSTKASQMEEMREDFINGKYFTYNSRDIYNLFGLSIDAGAKKEELEAFFAEKDNYQKCLNGFDAFIETWNTYKEEYSRVSTEGEKNAEMLKALEGKKINYKAIRLELVEKLFKKHLQLNNIKGFSERVFESKEELYETVDDYLSNNNLRNPIEILQFIKLFRAMGFEYGNDIKDYENAPAIKAFFKSEEIKKDYKNVLSELGKVKAENNVFYKEAIKDLQNYGKVYEINRFVAPIYSYIFFGRVNGYVKTAMSENGYETFCILPQYLMLDNRVPVHEMGHIIDTNFIKVNGKDYIKMGFTLSRNHLKQTDSDYDLNQVKVDKNVFSLDYDGYELFNEVVNDYFSVKIANRMREDGFSIGNHKDGHSYYSKAFVLMKDFIEENKQDLIDCKMIGSEKIIDERFGEENIDMLAAAVNQFLKNRPIDVKDIISSIIEKTGVEDIDIHQAVNMPCDWDSTEKEIVDIFKTVQQASKKIRERHSKQKTITTGKNNGQDYEFLQ